jgi:hypothetical protein
MGAKDLVRLLRVVVIGQRDGKGRIDRAAAAHLGQQARRGSHRERQECRTSGKGTRGTKGQHVGFRAAVGEAYRSSDGKRAHSNAAS